MRHTVRARSRQHANDGTVYACEMEFWCFFFSGGATSNGIFRISIIMLLSRAHSVYLSFGVWCFFFGVKRTPEYYVR